LAEANGVAVLPINIKFGNRIYRDSVDLSPAEAYQLFSRDPDLFSTSPASPAQYIAVLREASRRGNDVLCITVSSKLSTLHNVASLAAEQVHAEFPNTTVKVMDSETVLASEGFVVLEAAREAALGRDIDAVVRKAEFVKARVTFALVLETVRNVYRTGRVPKVAVQAMSVLPLKAILTVSGGAVRPQGVARNMRQGIDHILDSMRCRSGTSPLHVAVMHAYSPEEGERLRQRVSFGFKCSELWVTEVSPVVGYALGAGAIGLAYYSEADKVGQGCADN